MPYDQINPGAGSATIALRTHPKPALARNPGELSVSPKSLSYTTNGQAMTPFYVSVTQQIMNARGR